MNIDMVLRYSGCIDGIPLGKEAAWQNATRNDKVTVESWDKIWIGQTAQNSKTYNFSEGSAMSVFGSESGRPVILMGAGPSLAKNWADLVGDGKTNFGRRDIKIVTNVHNFPFLEDHNLMTSEDFYLILDAGDICIKEMSEGGANADNPDWYWERTACRTLVAYHGTHPEFLKKWRGKILWFTTPPASMKIAEEISKLIDITKVPVLNVGGNVMGAALYFARAVLGCSIPIFMGMDLSFSYNQKFHPWECWYNEKFTGVIPWIDIYGNRVWTWPSYLGFKSWFDFMACGGTGNNAQLWINATEGGILGAYPEGNIRQIVQMDLKTALHMFNMHHLLPSLIEKSTGGQFNLLF
jgi:hypothetical protein